MAPFTLGATARSAGYRLSGYERVGSTNIEAMAAARAGEQSLLWVAALEQTEGRGRRGRQWQSQFGNLAASLFVSVSSKVEEPGMLGFVAGVAMRRALNAVLPKPQSGLQLKWPNDVLYNGAKLVGILLEAEKSADGRLAIVIGMGVNVMSAPDDLPYAAASLHDIAREVSAPDLFEVLGEKWVDCFAIWDNGRGNGAILSEWREHAAGAGKRIQVKLPTETFEGVFESIDDKGRLCVRLDNNNQRLVTAGDIYFGGQQVPRKNVQ